MVSNKVMVFGVFCCLSSMGCSGSVVAPEQRLADIEASLDSLSGTESQKCLAAMMLCDEANAVCAGTSSNRCDSVMRRCERELARHCVDTTDPDAGTPEPDASVSEPDSSVSEPDASVSEPDATVMEPEPCTGACDESSSQIMWDGRAAIDGLSAWGRLESCSRDGESTNCDGFDRLDVVSDPTYGAVYQAAMTEGDVYRDKARAEFAKPEKDNGDTFYIHHGDDYFIGYRSKLSEGIDSLGNGDSNSGNLMQLKGKMSCGGPALGLTIKDGYLTLRREVDGDADIDSHLLGNSEGVFWRGPKISDIDGQWFELVLHINFNVDPNIGFVEVWFNGVKQSNNGNTKIHGKTKCFDDPEDTIELKLGIYRNERYNKGTFDYHWIHDPRIGTSYEAVAPR